MEVRQHVCDPPFLRLRGPKRASKKAGMRVTPLKPPDIWIGSRFGEHAEARALDVF
jgi:hypothetical protein